MDILYIDSVFVVTSRRGLLKLAQITFVCVCVILEIVPCHLREERIRRWCHTDKLTYFMCVLTNYKKAVRSVHCMLESGANM